MRLPTFLCLLVTGCFLFMQEKLNVKQEKVLCPTKDSMLCDEVLGDIMQVSWVKLKLVAKVDQFLYRMIIR